MATTARPPKITELIRQLDQAVSTDDTNRVCAAVKQTLCDLVGSGDDFLDASFLAPAPERYARRLLHKDPAGRYSVPCALIIGQRTRSTDQKTSLNAALRDFAVAV